MKHKILILAGVLAIGPLCSAAPLAFQDHNCSLEFPATWRMVNPLPSRALTAASSPDGHKTISLVAVNVRQADLPNAQRQMNDGIKKAFTAAGLQIVESQTMLAGISFHTLYSKTLNGGSAVSYTALEGHELYYLQVSSGMGDARSDAEVQSIIGSFRLLGAANTSSANATSNRISFRVGYIFGQALVLVLIGAAVLWLFRKLSSSTSDQPGPMPQPATSIQNVEAPGGQGAVQQDIGITQCPMCQKPIPAELQAGAKTCPACGADLTRWLRPRRSTVPPPLPIVSSPSSFPKQAASYSFFAPFVSIAIAVIVQPQVRGERLAMMLLGALQMLLIISGLILGVAALMATKRHGRAGIFGMAMAGTCINGLLVLAMLIAIPGLMKAIERAKALQKQKTEQRQ